MFTVIPLILLLSLAALAAVAYSTSSKAATRALMGALFFTVIGPPLGTLTFLLACKFSSEVSFGIIHFLIAFIPIVIVTYLMGSIPAAIVGALVGIFSIRFGVLLCCWLAGILGAGASMVLNGKWGHGFYEALAMLRLIDFLPSVVASILSTLLFHALIVRTNLNIFHSAGLHEHPSA